MGATPAPSSRAGIQGPRERTPRGCWDALPYQEVTLGAPRTPGRPRRVRGRTEGLGASPLRRMGAPSPRLLCPAGRGDAGRGSGTLPVPWKVPTPASGDRSVACSETSQTFLIRPGTS